MKKLLILFSMAIAFYACEKYEDYEVESVGFTTVYFPTQELKRSIVSGEGLQINIGAYLGGVRENTQDRSVKFVVDETLLAGTAYTLLPADYYTLANPSEIIIPKGEFLGMVGVKFDSAKLANDPLIKDFKYAIPLKITSTSVDSIHGAKDFTVIPLKLMNTWEGNFYQIGQMKEFYTIKPVLSNAFVYGDTLTYPKSPLRKLETAGMNMVVVDGIGTYSGSAYTMSLKINVDNSVEVLPVAGSTIQVAPLHASTWDPVKRTFHISYKFDLNGKYYEVEEDLIFRNRIRDGINEWRWEGFPGN